MATKNEPRYTGLYVIAALTMIEALIFGILFGVILDEIDDDRSIRGIQEKILTAAAGTIIVTYCIAFLVSIGLMFGAAKQRPVLLKTFYVFGIVKCIIRVAVAAIFINAGILVAGGILVIIFAVLSTYFIAIVAFNRKEMKKLLNTPVTTAPAATTSQPPFVGNQEGIQPPYNVEVRSFDNNSYPAPPGYGQPSGPPPSYFAENEAYNLHTKKY